MEGGGDYYTGDTTIVVGMSTSSMSGTGGTTRWNISTTVVTYPPALLSRPLSRNHKVLHHVIHVIHCTIIFE